MNDSIGPDGPAVLLEVKGSRFAADDGTGAVTLQVFADHLSTEQRVGNNMRYATLVFSQITAVRIHRVGTWRSVVIDTSTGTQETVPGLSAEEADEACRQIRLLAGVEGDDDDDEFETGTESDGDGAEPEPEPAPEPTLEDRLRDLNALRAQGGITDDEFKARKAELFGDRWRRET